MTNRPEDMAPADSCLMKIPEVSQEEWEAAAKPYFKEAEEVAKRMNPLPLICAWTEESSREWWTRCDRCGKRRIVADYHEMYGDWEKDEDWWWECMRCSFESVAIIAQERLRGEVATR